MPFNFDRSSIEAKLPPAGRHPANISDVNVSKPDDATWLNVSFLLESGHRLEHLVAIDAEESSRHLPRVGEGFAFIETLCRATGVDIKTLRESDDVIQAFLGKRVDVLVALGQRSGMPCPHIKAILQPAEETETTAE